MFGLFSPKCPLATHEKAWTEWRMRWLADKFGIERMLRAEVVPPTDDYLPQPWSASAGDARRLLDRLCAHLAIDPRTIDLEVCLDEQLPGVAGHYDRGERTVIRVAESQLAAPPKLVATLAHELAHDMLLGGGLLADDVSDHEWVTDLLPVFFGLGLFAANATVSEEYIDGGHWSWWSIGKQGYLPARIFGYALALFAFVRGENDPPWANYLRLDAASALRQGLRYVRKTDDTLFHPDTARDGQRTPTGAELAARLGASSASFRLAALWDIGERAEIDPALVAAVGRAVADRDAAVSGQACRALAALGSQAEPAVPCLVEALGRGDVQNRLRAACALAELGRRPDAAVPELCELLAEAEHDEVAEAAWALRQYGRLAEAAVPRLLDALPAALANCDDYLADALIAAVLAACDDASRRVSAHFADGRSGHGRIVLAAIERRRATIGE